MLPRVSDTLGYAYALNSVLSWLLTLCGRLHTCPNEMISLCMVEVYGISRAAPCSPLLGLCFSSSPPHTAAQTSWHVFPDLSFSCLHECLSLTQQVLCIIKSIHIMSMYPDSTVRICLLLLSAHWVNPEP